MRAFIICLIALLAIGCAARTPHPDAVRLYRGTYEFVGRVDNSEVTGRLTFREHEYAFESTFGSCIRPIENLLLVRVHDRASFSCEGLLIVLELRNGRFNDRANASYTRIEQVGVRRQCVRTRIDEAGRTVCVQYIDVPVENRVTRHGVVQVTHMEG